MEHTKQRDELIDIYHYTDKKAYEVIIKEGIIKALSPPFWKLNEDKGIKEALSAYGANISNIEKILGSDKRGILALDKPLNKGWIDSELMSQLLGYFNYKITGIIKPEIGEIYCFKLLVEPENIVVREHKYITKRYIRNNFGKLNGGMYREAIRSGLVLLKELEKVHHKPIVWELFRDAQKNIKDNPEKLWGFFSEEIKGLDIKYDKKHLRLSLPAVATFVDYLNSTIKFSEYKNNFIVPEFWYLGDYQLTPFVDGVKIIRLRSKSGKPNDNFKILIGEKEITKQDIRKFKFIY